MFFVDMDDVLADFQPAAAALHGVSNPKQLFREPWDMCDILQLTLEEFWQPIIELGWKFWQDLGPTPFFNDLVHHLESSGIDWTILTHPSNNVDCHIGKALWLDRHLEYGLNNLAFKANKHDLSLPGTILLDDKVDNVLKFNRGKGKAYLVPSYSGPLRRYHHDALNHLGYFTEDEGWKTITIEELLRSL